MRGDDEVIYGVREFYLEVKHDNMNSKRAASRLVVTIEVMITMR